MGLFDDHPAISAGLCASFDCVEGMEVLWSTDSLETLEKKYREQPPDVLVADFRIHSAEGEESILPWIERHPGACVVIYSGFYLEHNVRAAFERGIMAWVRKSDAIEDLHGAVRNAAIGKKTIRTSDEVFFRMNNLVDLSDREMDVLTAIYNGRSNKEISDELGISETTVKTHLAHIFAKLDVAGRSEAVRQGIERGLLSTPVESQNSGS